MNSSAQPLWRCPRIPTTPGLPVRATGCGWDELQGALHPTPCRAWFGELVPGSAQAKRQRWTVQGGCWNNSEHRCEQGWKVSLWLCRGHRQERNKATEIGRMLAPKSSRWSRDEWRQ